MSLGSSPVLLVIGGGRWGRVVISVLAGMDIPFKRVVVVSRSNNAKLRAFIRLQSTATQIQFDIVDSLDQTANIENIKTAIITNTARAHFVTAMALLRRGVHLLVEKPLSLSCVEASKLINYANIHNLALLPSMQYRFCSYLYNFKTYISLQDEEPVSFSITWSDPNDEERYGEVKTYDYSLNVAQDVMTHIWSILFTVFNTKSFKIDSCEIKYGGSYAHFSINSHDLYGEVTLERNSSHRKRILIVKMTSGINLAIDFSKEPGVLKVDDELECSADSQWEISSKPVARQLSYFFSLLNNSSQYAEAGQVALTSACFCEEASNLLKEQQRILLELAIKRKQKIEGSMSLAMRELLSDILISKGIVNIGNNYAIERKVMQIIKSINDKGVYDSEYVGLFEGFNLFV